MATTDTVGISRLVLYRRERAVMLVPRDQGIVLWTLRYGDEVREPEAYFGDLKAGTINPRLKGLVTKLIDELAADLPERDDEDDALDVD